MLFLSVTWQALVSSPVSSGRANASPRSSNSMLSRFTTSTFRRRTAHAESSGGVVPSGSEVGSGCFVRPPCVFLYAAACMRTCAPDVLFWMLCVLCCRILACFLVSCFCIQILCNRSIFFPIFDGAGVSFGLLLPCCLLRAHVCVIFCVYGL